MVLEAFKAITLKGRNDRIDVRTGHLETARDAVFVPPFVPHANDGPPGLIGLGEGGKRSLMCSCARSQSGDEGWPAAAAACGLL